MPRNRRFIHRDGLFHVGSRTNNKEWFEVPAPLVWKISTDLLCFTSRAFNLEVHAFVLMSNHYHLLLRTPEANLAEAMLYFQREFSKSIARESGRINHILGGPYFASMIETWSHHHAVYKYVYRNPVDAGICERVENYPYSSLRGLLGFEKMPLIVQDPLELMENTEGILNWLNFSFQKDQRECLRKGLRSPAFVWKTGKSKRNSWTNDLEFREVRPTF